MREGQMTDKEDDNHKSEQEGDGWKLVQWW
jgi:hypothetical protein